MLLGFVLMLISAVVSRETISWSRRRVRAKLGDVVSYEGPVPFALFFVGAILIAYSVYLARGCSKEPESVIIDNSTTNHFHERLNVDYRTPDVWVRRQPGTEMVFRDSGTYYLIDLRDRRANASIYFDPGKYNRDRLSAAYQEALDSLKAQVLDSIRTVPYRLYVVGTADTLDAEDPLLGTVLGDLPSSLSFLIKNPDVPGQWSLDERHVATPHAYNNDDLPNLRGLYLQEMLRGMGCDAILLEGSVIESNNPMDRRALLYLYWPDTTSGGSAGTNPPEGERPACR